MIDKYLWIFVFGLLLRHGNSDCGKRDLYGYFGNINYNPERRELDEDCTWVIHPPENQIDYMVYTTLIYLPVSETPGTISSSTISRKTRASNNPSNSTTRNHSTIPGGTKAAQANIQYQNHTSQEILSGNESEAMNTSGVTNNTDKRPSSRNPRSKEDYEPEDERDRDNSHLKQDNHGRDHHVPYYRNNRNCWWTLDGYYYCRPGVDVLDSFVNKPSNQSLRDEVQTLHCWKHVYFAAYNHRCGDVQSISLIGSFDCKESSKRGNFRNDRLEVTKNGKGFAFSLTYRIVYCPRRPRVVYHYRRNPINMQGGSYEDDIDRSSQWFLFFGILGAPVVVICLCVWNGGCSSEEEISQEDDDDDDDENEISPEEYTLQHAIRTIL